MKTFGNVIACILVAAGAWGQTLSVTKMPKLSATPTVQECVDLFIAAGRGQVDPFLALQDLISRSDKSVPALGMLLATQAIFGSDSSTMSMQPNRLYAVMALEAIGTDSAFAVLIRTALAHPDNDVRGYALRGLAVTCHNDALLRGKIPDREIIHLFLKSIDDTTKVGYLDRPFGEIARDGLINWAGIDMGQPQGNETRIVGAGGAKISLTQYREQWWIANAVKVSWNADSLRFVW